MQGIAALNVVCQGAPDLGDKSPLILMIPEGSCGELGGFSGVVSIHRLATEMGLPVERAELLMCRGLATLIARGYPAEDLCETYHLTPEQLSRAATTPVFSTAFEPLAAGR